MLEPAPQLLSSSSELLSSPSLPDLSLVVGIGKLNGQGIDLQVSEISTPATIVVFVLSAAFCPTIIFILCSYYLIFFYNKYIYIILPIVRAASIRSLSSAATYPNSVLGSLCLVATEVASAPAPLFIALLANVTRPVRELQFLRRTSSGSLAFTSLLFT